VTARSIRRNTQIQCKRACLATVVNAIAWTKRVHRIGRVVAVIAALDAFDRGHTVPQSIRAGRVALRRWVRWGRK